MTAHHAKKTILVIEHYAALRKVLEDLLGGAGYAVVLACNGQEAIECVSDGVLPDLILSDLQTPDPDRQGFLTQLKAIVAARSVPVVCMSWHSITRQQALASGWDGFIANPFERRDLLNEIRRCLTQPG